MGEIILTIGLLAVLFAKMQWFWHALAFAALGVAVMAVEKWDGRTRRD